MITPFFVHKTATTAADAFALAQADGGPIASKTAFTVYLTPVNVSPNAYARPLVDRNWNHIAETATPAACYSLPNSDFLFFGGIGGP